MKDLVINGRNFKYEVLSNDWDEFETLFYQGEKEITKKRFCIFGKEVKKIVPIFVFKIKNFNIENPRYSKENVKEILRKEVAVIDRIEEIRKGEIL